MDAVLGDINKGLEYSYDRRRRQQYSVDAFMKSYRYYSLMQTTNQISNIIRMNERKMIGWYVLNTVHEVLKNITIYRPFVSSLPFTAMDFKSDELGRNSNQEILSIFIL